ncbi:MAG: TauD/TfdA family dioxygenase [Burkholderiaceae bacterium]|nr:TauD/TfdA family dioxygenase [Burkholderiaceae bacterium]
MRIVDIPGPLGAEVSDFNPLAPLSSDEVRQIDEALGRRLVLRFRGHPFSARQFGAFAGQLGELQPHIAKQYHHPEDPNIVLMTNQDAQGNYDPVGGARGEGWHSDNTFEWIPAKATLLHSLAIPDSGGNTKFANMALAYQTLPASLRRQVDGRYGTFCLGGRTALNTQLVAGRLPPAVVHPLIRIHPQTGLPGVFANPTHSLGIVGMNESDANALLDELFAWCEREEFQWHQVWAVADTVMWDNRGAWHQAAGEYPRNQLRKFIRTTLRGTPTMDRQLGEEMLKQKENA